MKLKTVKLKEIVSMKYGKMPKPSIISENGYPIYSGYGVTGYAKQFLYKEPQLIVVARGVGGTGDVKISPENAWITNLSLVLELDKEKVDITYLYYKLKKEPLKKNLNTGAAQAQITIGVLENYKVTIPELAIQKRISSNIASYDNLIDTNRRRIELLEEASRLLFREWFVYFRFPGHEKVKIVDGVPGGWKKEKINRLVTFKRGVEPGSNNYLETYESGSFPFFRVSDLVTRNPSIFVDEQYAKSALLKKNDIVISLDGSVGIVSMGLEGCYSTGIRKLIIKDKKINRSYLYFLMKSHYIQGVINAYAKGTTIQHAGEAIKHLNPILPPQNLMDLFDGTANPALNEILILLDQNQKLAQARDLLLPRLMNGTIDVSESNIKVPEEAEI